MNIVKAITILSILMTLCGGCQQESATPSLQDHGGLLSHSVFFDLKDSSDLETFIRTLRELERIPVVKDLQIGTFADMNDARAMSQYEVGMEIVCSAEDYPIYQKHEIHEQVRKAVGPLLASPPAVYDCMVK